MPEAKVLFAVASIVILALVAWVVMVLRVPREPWARAPLHPPAPEPEAETASPAAAAEPPAT